jgi:hypothetical protein
MEIDCLEPPTHFNILFMGKSVSTNVAGIGTTYDVTSEDYCSARFGNEAWYFKKPFDGVSPL